MVTIPVAEEDYEKNNQFDEELIQNIYPALITEIRQVRQGVFSEHNKE